MIWLSAQLLNHRAITSVVILSITILSIGGTCYVDFEDDVRVDFRQDTEQHRRLEKFYEDFGVDFNDVLILIESANLFDADALAATRRALAEMEAEPGVVQVTSIFDVRSPGKGITALLPLIPESDDQERLDRARSRALRHPLIAGQLLSENGTAMFAWLRLQEDLSRSAELAPHLERLQQIAAEHSAESPIQISLTGQPLLRVHAIHTVRKEMVRLMIVSAAVAACIAFFLFRRLTAVLISTGAASLGMLWAVGAMGFLGAKVNGLNAILPTVIFVIGFTDAVHLIFENRRQLIGGASPRRAAADALRIVGPACAMTSLTTAVGFGSLSLARMSNVKEFGIACGMGTILCFLAVITTISLLASTRCGKLLAAVKTDRHSSTRQMDRLNKLLVSTFAELQRARWVTVVLTVLALVFLAGQALTLRPDLYWKEMLPRDSQLFEVTERCDQLLGGVMMAYVVVEWPAGEQLESRRVIQALADVHRVLRDEPLLRNPFSIANVLASLSDSGRVRPNDVRYLDRMPEDFRRRLLSEQRRATVVSAHVPDVGAAAQLPLFRRVRDSLAALEAKHPGIRLELTGTSVVASSEMHQMIGDLGRSLALASIVIFSAMVAAFRSLRVGLISIVPNAFPLAMMAGAVAWTGNQLSLTSAMTFSVCIGLAVDDTIHFIVRYRHGKRNGLSISESLREAYRTAGMAMLVTSLTLAGGFAAMLTSSLPPLRTFGVLSLGAILTALFADLWILPSFLLCFGNRGRG